MLIGEILIFNAHRYPNKLSIFYGGIRLNRKELNERVYRLANGIIDLGMCKKDSIAIISDNCSMLALQGRIEFYYRKS
jgi:non-ribosomal peptide synthetase component E (peptide arylation enzyme)